jgi:hypothetical protein
MYIVQATITQYYPDGWHSCIQVPTFLLDKSILGIVDEDHAGRIAKDIVNPTGDPTISVSACVRWVSR